MTLQKRYDQLATDRTSILMRARLCSTLSIPTLFPPEGAGNATAYPTPWQAMGARCVNNLAAKLLLALFPPNAPFFRLTIDDFTLSQIAKQDGARAEVEKGLNRIERAVMGELETGTARPSLFEALKQLIVSGNALLMVTPNNSVRVHRLDRYVVKRDPMGNPLEIITKECISRLELTDEVRELVGTATPAEPTTADTSDNIDLYTGWRLVKVGNTAMWRVSQEVKGVAIPGSNGTYPHDKCPARPLRWTALDGEDYGRGIFEEYLGDFKSLEGLQQAIVQGSVAAAKVLFLVKPNSSTKKDVIAKSESGDVASGNKEDVTVLQMEKYNDFKVAQETRNNIIQSLSFAFMLNTAIQRQGERVTAEEIRYMAQELESSLGGVYSTMSQDLQLPLVSILMSNMERAGKLPALPKGKVKPAITTGIEAIGRGDDITRLSSFLADLEPLGPGVAAQYINVGDYIMRAGTARQIDMDGLVKPDAQVQQEQQQAQMQALAQKVGPNVVNKGAEMMAAHGGGMPQPQGATPNG